MHSYVHLANDYNNIQTIYILKFNSFHCIHLQGLYNCVHLYVLYLPRMLTWSFGTQELTARSVNGGYGLIEQTFLMSCILDDYLLTTT